MYFTPRCLSSFAQGSDSLHTWRRKSSIFHHGSVATDLKVLTLIPAASHSSVNCPSATSEVTAWLSQQNRVNPHLWEWTLDGDPGKKWSCENFPPPGAGSQPYWYRLRRRRRRKNLKVEPMFCLIKRSQQRWCRHLIRLLPGHFPEVFQVSTGVGDIMYPIQERPVKWWKIAQLLYNYSNYFI